MDRRQRSRPPVVNLPLRVPPLHHIEGTIPEVTDRRHTSGEVASPLVRAAVYADITAASRAQAHAEAAVILRSEGANVQDLDAD